MSFQQPWLLVLLPLILLPIIIHLINQRRFQTIEWAAMMFLLAAHRMSRGYSRIRQWLILFFRTLAVAGLLFAVSRPLASGWLGVAGGGTTDTTIILVDRSPSMQARAAGTGESKQVTGQKQLVEALATLGSNKWIVIDSVSRTPIPIDSPEQLLNLPAATPAAAPADWPLLLQAAHDYIRDNRPGRTEVWLSSDLQASNWNTRSGLWKNLREAFLSFPQSVRFHLLAFPSQPEYNHSIKVTNVTRRTISTGAEVLLSFQITCATPPEAPITIPVEVELEGARSVLNVQVSGQITEIKEHRIPVEATRERGWGQLSLPADSNPADDTYYFVFDKAPPRNTLVVAEEPTIERPLALMASIGPEPQLAGQVQVAAVEGLSRVDWEQIGLVVWQASFPAAEQLDLLNSFLARGGQILFFPPSNSTEQEFLGMKWSSWRAAEDPFPVETWRGDEDLLMRTLSGTALPVGQLEVRKYCRLEGEATRLASFTSGDPLVVRIPTNQGAAYAWTTTPAPDHSNLATNGVVLYAFLQRALSAGAASLSLAKQQDAKPLDQSLATSSETWTQLSTNSKALSIEVLQQAGVYTADNKLVAINRPAAEDATELATDTEVAEAFQGLDFSRVDREAGSFSSLIQEIWRLFLIGLIIALLLEALLCIPKPARQPTAPLGAGAAA